MKAGFIILILFSLVFTELNAQSEKRKITFSGILIASDSPEEISYANIFEKQSRTGTLSDHAGSFSMEAHPGDTIIFTAFGYKKSNYVIPYYIKEDKHAVIHSLLPDPFLLPEVDIYPWPSKEQFAKAFVEMDPYGQQYKDLRASLSGKELYKSAQLVQPDAGLIYKWEFNQLQNSIYSKGMFPVTGLLNPLTWYFGLRDLVYLLGK